MEPILADALTMGRSHLPELPTSPRWYRRAACAGAPLDVFFAERGDDANQVTEYAARRYCNACPVRDDCLTYAIENRLKGVWAGTSEAERKEMRKQGCAA